MTTRQPDKGEGAISGTLQRSRNDASPNTKMQAASLVTNVSRLIFSIYTEYFRN